MVETPVEVPYRPSAIKPNTMSMTPDGFFVTNIGVQLIHTTIRNLSGGPLDNVRAYIEGFSDPNIRLTSEIKNIGTVPTGASFPVSFQADFSEATPGIALVSFIIESDNYEFRRVLKKIFITKISYDENNKSCIIHTPQGFMTVTINEAIMNLKEAKCGKINKDAFLFIPLDLTYVWHPIPYYSGKRGPFPYEDPLWKVLVSILIFLLAMLIDYLEDGDLDMDQVFVKTSGTFDEVNADINCCNEWDVSVKSEEKFEQWLYKGAIGAIGILWKLGDFPDLQYRGQEATIPQPQEKTIKEEINVKVNFDSPPSPGHKFKGKVDWKYTRTTTGDSYTHEESDQKANDIHILEGYEVQAPTIHDRMDGPLAIRARFKRPDGNWYRGAELYVFGHLISTSGELKTFEMVDHGMNLDEKENDSWYTGGFYFYQKMPRDELSNGDWYLFVIAQDVNTTKEGIDPIEAAKTIGGMVLTPQLDMSFDGTCKLKHDNVIHII